MDFSFLHAADLHLGSPFLGLSSTDEELACRVASASREAFEGLARIIHDCGDTKSLFCYKHVVATVLVVAREAFACPTIARHSVCCSPIFFPSLPCCSSIIGRAVPMAEPCC